VTSGWRVEEAAGAAADLHHRDLTAPLVRTVRVNRVERPALVLGSAQPLDAADAEACAAAGVDIARRRSGGGAVLLEPGQALWVDVEVPRGDELWDDDIVRSSWWLGETWAAARGGGQVHRGQLVATEWSPLVCFAGLGPGEVTVGGAKAVGISQRRTRAGARFQCVVPGTWDPARLAGLLAIAPERREALVADLAAAVHPEEVAIEALIAALP
jgi:lipoate-protein ligase A